MTKNSLPESRSYGTTTVTGSAAPVLGDVHHSVKYNIQHANINCFDDNTHARTPFQTLINRGHLEKKSRSGKGLALLSFDGGLDGGLGGLYILKHFMERVGQAQGLECAPKPNEFFDMIGGAGIGGYVGIPHL